MLKFIDDIASCVILVQICQAKTDWALLLGSVTRLGDLLNFGQLFKAFGNNQFVQISHILRQFL